MSPSSSCRSCQSCRFRSYPGRSNALHACDATLLRYTHSIQTAIWYGGTTVPFGRLRIVVILPLLLLLLSQLHLLAADERCWAVRSRSNFSHCNRMGGGPHNTFMQIAQTRSSRNQTHITLMFAMAGAIVGVVADAAAPLIVITVCRRIQRSSWRNERNGYNNHERNFRATERITLE